MRFQKISWPAISNFSFHLFWNSYIKNKCSWDRYISKNEGRNLVSHGLAVLRIFEITAALFPRFRTLGRASESPSIEEEKGMKRKRNKSFLLRTVNPTLRFGGWQISSKIHAASLSSPLCSLSVSSLMKQVTDVGNPSFWSFFLPSL